MSSKKINCLNCAFCIRERSYYYGMPISKWKYKKETLSAEQRLKIYNKEIFLDEEKKIFEEWEKEYNKRNVENRKNNFMVIDALMTRFPNAEKLGMGDVPKCPEDDEISCYKKQWKKSYSKENLDELTDIIENNRCECFFSSSGNEGLDLEGIENKQIRTMELENILVSKRNLKISNWAFFTSIIVVFISLFSIYFSYKSIEYSSQSLVYSVKDDEFDKGWKESQELQNEKIIQQNKQIIKVLNNINKQNKNKYALKKRKNPK